MSRQPLFVLRAPANCGRGFWRVTDVDKDTQILVEWF